MTNLINKEFTLSDNVKISWVNKAKSWTNIPADTMKHPKSPYNTHNLVWKIPSTNKMINKFKFSFSDNFDNDFRKLTKLTRNRTFILFEQMDSGHIFDDDDDFTSSHINIKDDELYYNWDPSTHYLNDFQKHHSNALAYSKNVGLSDEQERLLYLVFKPKEDENGNWYSRVHILSCWDHIFEGNRYGAMISKAKLADYSSEENRNLEALIKAKNYHADGLIKRY